MTCRQYREYSERVSKSLMQASVPRDIHDTPEYKAWQEHSDSCARCEQWEMDGDVRRRGVDPADFPCVHLAYYSTTPGDPLVLRSKSGTFGLRARTGRGAVRITHCPWCGVEV